MNSLGVSVIILLISVFISSVSQIILKKSANRTYTNIIAEYVNPYVIGAYSLFFLSTFLTMIALKKVPMSMSPVLEATGYLHISVMGYLFLGERVNRRKAAGLVLILLGILIYSVRGVG